PGFEVLLRPAAGRAWGVTEKTAGPTIQLLCDGDAVAAAGLEVGIDQIVEVAIPWEALDVRTDEPVDFAVEGLEGTQSRDRAPREGTIHLTRPSEDFEQIMWDV